MIRFRRFLHWLASQQFTVICLFYLGLLLIGGTIYQSQAGIYAAQQKIFASWLFFVFRVFPLPGMALTGALLLVNLLAAFLVRLRFHWRQGGLLLIHGGLLLLIGGGFFIAATAQEGYLTLGEGERSQIFEAAGTDPARPVDELSAGVQIEKIPLPLSLKLIDFKKETYPGSDIARSFTSRIEIAGSGWSRQAIISMNRPFRYREYTFYQSSYSEGPGATRSTFFVVRSHGRWLPYVASFFILLGLAFHFLGRLFLRPGQGRPRSTT